MKAFIFERTGEPSEVLSLKEIAQPTARTRRSSGPIPHPAPRPVRRAKIKNIHWHDKTPFFKGGRTWFAVVVRQQVPHKRGTNGAEICCSSLLSLKGQVHAERHSMNTTQQPVAIVTGAKPGSRLRELGLVLPKPPSPLGAYVEASQVGSLLFLSGTLPLVNGKLAISGRLGANLSVDQGREAARLAALNALAAAQEHVGELDRLRKLVFCRLNNYTLDSGGFL